MKMSLAHFLEPSEKCSSSQKSAFCLGKQNLSHFWIGFGGFSVEIFFALLIKKIPVTVY
jgi:hypothetical protein